jgi:hypothetical protein
MSLQVLYKAENVNEILIYLQKPNIILTSFNYIFANQCKYVKGVVFINVNIDFVLLELSHSQNNP